MAGSSASRGSTMAGMDFVSRKDWGARYAAGTGSRDIPTSEAWLHHTVTLAPDLAFTDLNEDSVDDDECEAMRTIERIGQQRFGAGFSYNLAGMPSGRWYVGCGVRRIGTHTGGRNSRALGLVLVGNYEDREVPAPLRASLVEVLRFGYAQGWIDRPALDGGHRDLKQTSCPGRFAYSLIPQINKEAAGKAAPTPVPPSALEGKVYFVYSHAGLDWGSDGITRRPFETQEAKNQWVADIKAYGSTVTRKVLTPEQAERLIPIGVNNEEEPAAPAPEPAFDPEFQQ